MEIITIYDYLLLPVYIIILFIFILRASKKYKGSELRKFFIVAFFLRVLGCEAHTLLIYYYYGTGDIISYYNGAEVLADMIKDDVSNLKHLFAGGAELVRLADIAGYADRTPVSMDNDANAVVMKIAALISFISFGKFLIISLFFSVMSFLGVWKIFSFLNEVSGHKYQKVLAWLVLYTPSIWFFGSGLHKEPLCMLGIGYCVYYFYKNFVLKKYKFSEVVLILVMLYMLFLVKNYIAVILVLGLPVVLIYNIISRTKNVVFRGGIIVILFIGMIFSVTVIDTASIVEQGVEFAINQIQASKRNYETIQEQDENIKSGFTISDIDPSLGSLLLHSGEAFVATLFRPFPWESKKIFILFASLEAFLTLLATLYVLFKSRFIGFFATIFSSPLLLYCFTISVMFGVLIGFTTFNFGTVVRYKIVFFPFYLYFLLAVYTKYKVHHVESLPVQPVST